MGPEMVCSMMVTLCYKGIHGAREDNKTIFSITKAQNTDKKKTALGHDFCTAHVSFGLL